ncbi:MULTISPECIES: GNAT family N-acetyltransferase [unclassified Shewanella]|uniref:GNAT family N-acetyltransferase n=1 Tax=unclassified Shewanella TaxID=196818 RepID=UPI000C84FC75|nr:MULTISPECIES: GNAT family N-acetyltransferase [unclassified Shewanella]MDO6775329.1 GNAT family N-acetyltransferase [Shewanella sp. 3_MG-2023]PMG40468.1 GNAT family N-acetyltransferase [Shewanella sp. 10N.286.52.B9]
MISYQPTADLYASADITFKNMRSYYEHYSVNWEQSKIHEQIVDLENWDILYNASVVGAIRLAFDNDGCYIRDLQVSEKFQNNGIGAAALTECERLAIKAGVNKLRLRVLKISPAYHLYIKNGFEVDKEEDRFFYMSRKIS